MTASPALLQLPASPALSLGDELQFFFWLTTTLVLDMTSFFKIFLVIYNFHSVILRSLQFEQDLFASKELQDRYPYQHEVVVNY